MSLTISRNIGEKLLFVCRDTGKKAMLTFESLDLGADRASFSVEVTKNDKVTNEFKFTIGLDEVSPDFLGGDIVWAHSKMYPGYQARIMSDFPRNVAIHRILKDGTVLMPKNERV